MQKRHGQGAWPGGVRVCIKLTKTPSHKMKTFRKVSALVVVVELDREREKGD